PVAPQRFEAGDDRNAALDFGQQLGRVATQFLRRGSEPVQQALLPAVDQRVESVVVVHGVGPRSYIPLANRAASRGSPWRETVGSIRCESILARAVYAVKRLPRARRTEISPGRE